MTSGLVVSVTPSLIGDTLSADVTAGATVLPVFNAGEFDEEYDEDCYLVVGESTTPLRYIAVENDDDATQQSVTLAAAIPFDAEAGLPVTIWDPTVEPDDKRAVEFQAQVRLDDQDDATITATIGHSLVPLAGIYSLEGAQVSLEEDEGEWFVDRVLGRAPVVDSGRVATPKALGLLNVDGLWPTGTFGTIQDFGAYDLDAISYNSLTGIWTFNKPGYYLALLNVTFSANMAGDRIARVRIHYVDGATDIGSVVKAVPVENASALQVSELRYFFPGQGISMEARQTSGGDLQLLGSNGDLGVRPTCVSIVRVAI